MCMVVIYREHCNPCYVEALGKVFANPLGIIVPMGIRLSSSFHR